MRHSIMMMIFCLINSWISGPIGLHLNVSDKKCSYPESNDILSRAYEKCKSPGEETVRLYQIKGGIFIIANCSLKFLRERLGGPLTKCTSGSGELVNTIGHHNSLSSKRAGKHLLYYLLCTWIEQYPPNPLAGDLWCIRVHRYLVCGTCIRYSNKHTLDDV